MIKRFLYRIFCGFFLGISVFAPGFSGSVVAIVMGIYQDMVRIVSNPFKGLKRNIIFCLPLGIGAAVSAVLFVVSFKFLFDSYEKATYLLFVGLIAGNLPVIFSEIKKCGFKSRYLIGAVVTYAAAFAFGLLAAGVEGQAAGGGVSAQMMALGGVVTGAIALIPGMSVSMVLIVMGVYRPLIFIAESILHMNFAYLVPLGIFGVCAFAGLVITARGIKYVFEKFPGLANSLVFGFMGGSLVSILLQSITLYDAGFNWLLGGAMMAAGLCVSMLFVVMAKAMNRYD